MSQYDKFFHYLDDLRQAHLRLAVLLGEKLDAIVRNDTLRLDDIMKEEQVFVLSSKGFDSNIQRFCQQLSLKGKTLSTIIPELPLEEQQRFRALFTELKSSIDESQALNGKCQDLIGDHLHNINKTLKAIDKSRGTHYGKAAENATGERPHLFTKSI